MDLPKLGAGGFWSQRAKCLSSQEQGDNSDSADQRPWPMALSRPVWLPTVVAGTLQVNACLYPHRSALCVSAEPRELFPIRRHDWLSCLGLSTLLSAQGPIFLTVVTPCSGLDLKGPCVKVWSPVWHSGEAVIPLGRGEPTGGSWPLDGVTT